MNTMHLQSLISQFNAADDSAKSAIKNDLLVCYYHLTAPERQTMRSAMQPFVIEIEKEMLPTDPLAQEANELISRLAGQSQVLR